MKKICSTYGTKVSEIKNEVAGEALHMTEKDCYSLVQNMEGLIGFRIDENFMPMFIEGAVEDVTGYSKEELLSGKVKWKELILPEDLPLVVENIKKSLYQPNKCTEMEYRIRRKDGEIRWVRKIIQMDPESSKIPGHIQGLVRDITRHKAVETAFKKMEEARIKEIHHRIKNNLQVISALLSLEAEKFNDEKVLESFRESQNRIASMTLIHEELYKKEEIDKLDFADYLRKLTSELFSSYRLKNDNIKLKLDLEQAYLGMDTAIPLGIIVNELVSNALKHAFPEGKEGEIHISFCRAKDNENMHKNPEKPQFSACPENHMENQIDPRFALVVKDNGKGLPERLDLKKIDTFGLQLVNILAEQVEGHLEFRSGRGTEISIIFGKSEFL